VQRRKWAAAIRRLQSVDAHIGYAHEWDTERDCRSKSPPPTHSWLLRKIFGEQYNFVPDIFMLSNFVGSITQLEPLAKLTTVTGVGITNSAIDDEVAPILAALPNLEHLSLYGSAVTDAVFASLVPLQKLQSLVVTKTNVTAAGVAEFRQRKPNCKTYLGDGQADPASSKLFFRITCPTTYQPEFVDLILQTLEDQLKVEQELDDGLLLSPLDLDLRTDCDYLEGLRALIQHQLEEHGLDQIEISIEAA